MPSPNRLSLLLAAAFATAGLSSNVRAAEQCARSTMDRTPPAINFRVDNDLLGGADQDQGYTNGALITLVSPNLVDYTDDPCLPRLARWVNSHLERLHPGEFKQQNMVFSFGQGIFTPTDYTRKDVIPDDRPYAGILMASFGYNARNDDHLRTTAIKSGATAIDGTRAVDARVENGRVVAVIFSTGEDTFEIGCERLVVADGVRSGLGKMLGREWHRDTVYGVAGRSYVDSAMSEDPWISSHLELRGEQGEILSGYGWIFPLGDGSVNLGVGTLATAKRPEHCTTRPSRPIPAMPRPG